MLKLFDTFSPQELRDNYHKWIVRFARIIVDGDIDPAAVEKQIKSLSAVLFLKRTTQQKELNFLFRDTK